MRLLFFESHVARSSGLASMLRARGQNYRSRNGQCVSCARPVPTGLFWGPLKWAGQRASCARPLLPISLVRPVCIVYAAGSGRAFFLPFEVDRPACTVRAATTAPISGSRWFLRGSQSERPACIVRAASSGWAFLRPAIAS